MVSFRGWNRNTVLMVVGAIVLLVLVSINQWLFWIAIPIALLAGFAQWLTWKTNPKRTGRQ
jgi:hypothetical protein